MRHGALVTTAAALVLAAVPAAGAESIRVNASVINPTWSTERFINVAYDGPREDADRIWISRDRARGACPELPSAQTTRGARWITGRPGRGASALEAYVLDPAGPVAAAERGHVRVCAWVRSESVDGETGDVSRRWFTHQDTIQLRRVVPTARERRLAVTSIRRALAPAARFWARFGARAVVIGPKISRIDPTFALAAVVGASRADRFRVQGGHTIYHLRNGRWHPLGPLMGDTSRWCDEEGTGSAGQVPERVLNGFLGQRVCRW